MFVPETEDKKKTGVASYACSWDVLIIFSSTPMEVSIATPEQINNI